MSVPGADAQAHPADNHAMEVPPFTCPYCDTELQLPENAWYYTCPHCGNRLDLTAQFAYLRGLDAFSEGQDIMQSINPRKRRQVGYNPRESEAMTLFLEAYSSLQLAFQTELADFQRSLGVEMMSSMANEFMRRNMISALEMNYWNILMMEQTAQAEYDQLKEKLARPAGPASFLVRWRQRSRQKTLLKSLLEIDGKIAMLEKQIDFTDVPRGRNKHWRP